MLGTNKANQPNAIQISVTAHRDIINLLRKRNLEILIFVGLPFQEWQPFPEMRLAYQNLDAELNS